VQISKAMHENDHPNLTNIILFFSTEEKSERFRGGSKTRENTLLFPKTRERSEDLTIEETFQLVKELSKLMHDIEGFAD